GNARTQTERHGLLVLLSSAQVEPGIKPHTKNRSTRQVDVLALGGRNRSAAANEDAGERALHPAEDAADDHSNTGASANLRRLTANARAFDCLRNGPTDWILASVDTHLIERDRQT